ncbi:MAG: superoxide dismutase, partial [Chitinophagales bacterium]
IHYTKHHAAYIKNLNDAVQATPELQGKSLLEIVKNLDSVPEHVRTKVRNNAGGHWNHTFFWQILSGNAARSNMSDSLRAAMMQSFNDMDNFKAEFNKVASGIFGSGWAWLVKLESGELQIMSTPNQDNPLMDRGVLKGKPILGVDVWEHAYYLKYQNRRADYLSAFWNVVDWDAVSAIYSEK